MESAGQDSQRPTRADVARADTSSYDQIPYTSLAFPQTHPDHLAAIARIFRLSPPNVAACRVLELGCASGGNLIPMAFNLPGSQFVGIDLSRHQVDEAQEAIGALSLRNIRIEHASILDVDEGWGTFDYIICHGVFSWVETGVQDKLLSVAAQNLAHDGVAYISYNTYPGWHMREMVRHMMRYHAGQFAEPQEQVDQARALLKFLVSASPEAGPYNQLLSGEAERLGRSPDSYLFHEHLERTNLPIYFHQFIERAERAGLQYLSEAVLSETLTSHFPPPVAATLERISPDLLHLEQYMDFVRNRQFRQTLLCHEGLRPTRALSSDVLHGLMVSSPAVSDAASPDLAAGVAVVFTNGTRRAKVASPATKAALTVLMERWPAAIDVDELGEIALERGARFPSNASVDDIRGTMMEELFGGVMYGLIELHTQPPPCTNSPTDTPRAHPMAAFQAKRGNLVVNAHHAMFQLDALAVEVLKLSNGQRRRAEMIEVFTESFDAGKLELENEGQPVTDPHTARAMLSDRLEKAIATLTRSALLVD
jgi:methyltransferase-like protein/2-polyprenyl-3-methyl-5-hydroxy-6-metoxy-1,4-benzoquinol methylase